MNSYKATNEADVFKIQNDGGIHKIYNSDCNDKLEVSTLDGWNPPIQDIEGIILQHNDGTEIYLIGWTKQTPDKVMDTIKLANSDNEISIIEHFGFNDPTRKIDFFDDGSEKNIDDTFLNQFI